jgi:CheY-like chemotaxis protein
MTAKTVLIVDDSRVARMVVIGLTGKIRPDWSLCEAASADEALAIIEETAIDLALIDNAMPGMSGLELVERLRRSNPDLAIALITANIQDAVRRKAEALGVGFVEKPATEGKLEVVYAGIDS